jgi:microsomal dipeptidase-like Zn-dependent dipeptidase
LDIADREQGEIGDKVKEIAKAQNNSKDDVAEKIDKIKNRNGFKTFLIGTDYKNVGQLRSEMVTTQNHIDQLNKLLDKTTNAADKTALQEEIQALTKEQQKINDFIKANESKFSLLGWFVKLFNR